MINNSGGAEIAGSTERRTLKNKPFLKWAVIVVILVAVAVGIYALAGNSVSQVLTGYEKVDFTVLKSENIPKSIETDILPEYRNLERALACILDGKVYVVVTRGEKPTAGYGLKIEDLRLEKDGGKENLLVKTLFTEPAVNDESAAVITYPYQVAETALTKLPDTIELVIKYAE